MKIKKMMLGLSAVLSVLVFATGSSFAGPGTPAVSVTGGPTTVTLTANASSPTTLTPSFTLVNANTAYPVSLTSVTFTSSGNYTVTSPILLTGCTYNGEPAIPASGQGTCTATVQLTGTTPTNSPISGTLSIDTSAGTAKSAPVSITVAAGSSPATWTLDANSINPSQPISVGDTVTAQYTLANTDSTNSLTFSDPVAGFSGTAGVLSNEQILSSGSNNCESLSGTLPAGQSCVYSVQATGAAAGTANITLDVTTNGTGGPSAPVASPDITVEAAMATWTLSNGTASQASIPQDGKVTSKITYIVTNTSPSTVLNLTAPSISNTGGVATATLDPATTCSTSLAANNQTCNYIVDVAGNNSAAGTAVVNLTVNTSNGSPPSQTPPTPVSIRVISAELPTIPLSDWNVGNGSPSTASVLSGGAKGADIKFTVTNNSTSTPLVLSTATPVPGGTNPSAITATVTGAPTCSAFKGSSKISSPVAGPNGGTCTYTVHVVGTSGEPSNQSATVGLKVASENGGGSNSSATPSTITVYLESLPQIPASDWNVGAASPSTATLISGSPHPTTLTFTVTNTSSNNQPLQIASASVSLSGTNASDLTAGTPVLTCSQGSDIALPDHPCTYTVAVTANSGVTEQGTAIVGLTVTAENAVAGNNQNVSQGSSTLTIQPAGANLPALGQGALTSSDITTGQTTTATYEVTTSSIPITLGTPVASSSVAGVLGQFSFIDPSSGINCNTLPGGTLAANSECYYTVEAQGLAAGSAAISLNVPYTIGSENKTSLTASSGLVTVTGSGNTVVWSLAANSSSINLLNQQTKTIYFAVDNQDSQNSLNIVDVPTVHVTGTDPSSITAAFDTTYPSSGAPGVGCSTSAGAALAPGTCYYAVDVAGVAAGTATINLGVLTSNGASTDSSCSTKNGEQGCYASTDATVTEVSKGLLTITPPTSPVNMIVGENNKGQNAILYTVTIPDGTAVGSQFTITDVKLLTAPKGTKDPSLSPTVQVCNQNDGEDCSANDGPNGTDWCNGGGTDTIGQQVANVPNSCTLNLLASTKIAGTYQTTLQVDYTESGDDTTYSSYSSPVTFQAQSPGATYLQFTQQPSPLSMDPTDSTGQTLVYEVRNTGPDPIYIQPQLLLNPMNVSGGTGNASGVPYKNATVVLGCGDGANTPVPEGEVPANGGTCDITVNLPGPANVGIAGPILYDEFLTIPYSTTSGFSSATEQLQFPLTFQVISMKNSRTVTFENNCNAPLYLALSSATVPSGGPLACTNDSDCFPGAHCVSTQAGGGSAQCYFLNPVPAAGSGDNPYFIGAGQSTVVTIPQQNLISIPGSSGMLGLIANMTIAARTECGPGAKACAVSDCSDPANNKGGGNFMPGWGCAPSGSVAPPGTLVELNLGEGTTQGAVDTYDMSLVNGYSVPVALAVDSGDTCATISGNPYMCGTAGDTTSQGSDENTIGAATWEFNWQQNQPTSGFNFSADDVPYLSMVTAGGSKTCTQTSDCGQGGVCGVSMTAMGALTTAGQQPNLTCGKFLGYWAPGQACTTSKGYAGRPYYCSQSIKDAISATSYTLSNLYQCASPNASCYYSGAPGKTCCGCANWGGTNSSAGTAPPPGDNPFGNMSGEPQAGDPSNPTAYPVQWCNSYNTAWLYGTSVAEGGSSSPASGATTAYPFLFYSVMKTAAPSVYTFQYDDPTSTFQSATTASVSSSAPTNFVNHTVTFCPGNTNTVASALNPDSASALQQQQQQAAAIQNAKANVKAKAGQAKASGGGDLKGQAADRSDSGAPFSGVLSKAQSLIGGSSS